MPLLFLRFSEAATHFHKTRPDELITGQTGVPKGTFRTLPTDSRSESDIRPRNLGLKGR
jgi:hypothetical protein